MKASEDSCPECGSKIEHHGDGTATASMSHRRFMGAECQTCEQKRRQGMERLGKLAAQAVNDAFIRAIS